jgi:hypothetical protein
MSTRVESGLTAIAVATLCSNRGRRTSRRQSPDPEPRPPKRTLADASSLPLYARGKSRLTVARSLLRVAPPSRPQLGAERIRFSCTS